MVDNIYATIMTCDCNTTWRGIECQDEHIQLSNAAHTLKVSLDMVAQEERTFDEPL